VSRSVYRVNDGEWSGWVQPNARCRVWPASRALLIHDITADKLERLERRHGPLLYAEVDYVSDSGESRIVECLVTRGFAR